MLLASWHLVSAAMDTDDSVYVTTSVIVHTALCTCCVQHMALNAIGHMHLLLVML